MTPTSSYATSRPLSLKRQKTRNVLVLLLVLVNRILTANNSLLTAAAAALVESCSSEPDHQAQCRGHGEKSGKTWKRTKHTLSNFEVAGVNLATYGMEQEDADAAMKDGDEIEPYELYEAFSLIIKGDETWEDLLGYRANKLRRSVAFYHDKVGLKRWLPSQGFDIPQPFVLKYRSELPNTGNINDTKDAILKLLPTGTDYVAKPSDNHRSEGLYVVKHDIEKNITLVYHGASSCFTDEGDFDPNKIAASLATGLYEGKSPYFEKFHTNYIEPGIVIEQRFTAFDFEDEDSALEFKVRTIWGRVHVAKWRFGRWYGEWYPGVVDRNGKMVEGSEFETIPDWIDWSRVVEIAERLGANKDMFRVDIIVGVPAGSPALQVDASESERQAAVQYVVSECEASCWEPFPVEVNEESLRLWISGYMIGNYRTIQNTEVPLEFQDTT